MATYDSAQFALLTSKATGDHDPLRADELAGRIRLARFSILTTATIATGDVYQLTRLPAGARFLAVVVSHESAGTTAPADIGDATDGDRLVTAFAFATASTANTPRVLGRFETGKASAREPALGVGYRYTADTDILLTFGTVSSGAAAGVEFEGFIAYTVD